MFSIVPVTGNKGIFVQLFICIGTEDISYIAVLGGMMMDLALVLLTWVDIVDSTPICSQKQTTCDLTLLAAACYLQSCVLPWGCQSACGIHHSWDEHL